MNKSFKSKYFYTSFGFTLAEVLITLGIIGVVAALTIPSLINNYQKSRDYNAMKKAYSTISAAASLIRNDNAGSMAGLATDNDTFTAIFKQYFRVLKSCGANDASCYPYYAFKNLQGGVYGGWVSSSIYPLTLNSDGTVYFYSLGSVDCDGIKYIRNGNYEACGVIFVDINGSQKPNTFGKDIFDFSINKYNVTPYRDMPNAASNGEFAYCQENGTTTWNGADCAYRAIQEGGIKYY